MGGDETIRRVNGYGADAYTYYPVIAIGAGFSGLAAGCRLKSDGFDQFRIFERQSGVGGTWWINRYPGVACDVPAVFYSFSFAPSTTWTRFFPSGPEIVGYLHGVCERYGITDKVQLNTDVVGCKWLEREKVWEVELRHLVPGMGDLSVKDREEVVRTRGVEAVYCGREMVRAKVVLSAVGGLVEPRGWPDDIPGKEHFQGPIFHSARWDYNVDLKDKDVVVVGTGCSAAQFVPQLTGKFGARSVTQLMRSPPWVVPRQEPPGGDAFWERWGPTLMTYAPGLNWTLRELIAASAEWDMRLFQMGSWNDRERGKVEKDLLAWMRKTVPEKYHQMLTPDYGVGCKRRIFDATWFPGLKDPKIELTTQPLKELQERSVTIGPGRTYPPEKRGEWRDQDPERSIPADVIILANGFDTTKWLHPLHVTGRGGRTLDEVWEERGGPQAYLGAAMDGFPNFFVIFGPNTVTGHSSVIMATENMTNYALNFVEPVLRGEVETVEVKKEAEVEYTRDIQKKLKGTVWASGGCNSWYFDSKTGWNSTTYPYTQIWFTLRCMFPTYSDWNVTYTRKGLLRLYLRRGLRALAMLALALVLLKARQRGFGLRDVRAGAKQLASLVTSSGQALVQRVTSAL